MCLCVAVVAQDLTGELKDYVPIKIRTYILYDMVIRRPYCVGAEGDMKCVLC